MSFCSETRQPQWATDTRFATNAARVQNRTVLIPLLRQVTVQHSTAEWIALLERANVPCGPINNLQQVFEDPQVQARGLQQQLPHPVLGNVPTVASPLRLSKTPVRYVRAAPSLGADTAAVLTRFSLNALQAEPQPSRPQDRPQETTPP